MQRLKLMLKLMLRNVGNLSGGGGVDVPLMSTIELVLYCHTWYCNVTFASDWIKIVSRFIQFESLTIMKFEMVWRVGQMCL